MYYSRKIQTNHLLPKCRNYFMRALIKMSLGTIIRHVLSMIQLPRINEYNLAKLWMKHTVIYFGRNIWRKMKIVRYCSNSMIWAENMECLHIIIKGKKLQRWHSSNEKNYKVSLNQLSKIWVVSRCGDNNGKNKWNKPSTLNFLLQTNPAVNIFSSPLPPLSVALGNS